MILTRFVPGPCVTKHLSTQSSSGRRPWFRFAVAHMRSSRPWAMGPPFFGVKRACAMASGTVLRRSSFAVTPMRSGE